MKEQQSRGYIVGRIGKKDPWARQWAQQLNERVARCLVLVYDWEKLRIRHYRQNPRTRIRYARCGGQCVAEAQGVSTICPGVPEIHPMFSRPRYCSLSFRTFEGSMFRWKACGICLSITRSTPSCHLYASCRATANFCCDRMGVLYATA